MKTLITRTQTTLIGSLLLIANVSLAQPGGSPAGVDTALVQLFGDVKAFSAKCEMRMLEKDQSEKMSGPMDFALLDGKMRVEVDMTAMKAKEIPAGAADGLKQMGMDRVVSIVLPKKKSQYIIYPGAKSCVSLPLSKEQQAALDSTAKIEKTQLGKETIDGHACAKNKVVLTSAGSTPEEYIVWTADDLKDFPLQIQATQDGNIVMMLFKQIQLSKPDAAKFEIPSDYKQYDDMGSFMQAMMLKMMPGQ